MRCSLEGYAVEAHTAEGRLAKRVGRRERFRGWERQRVRGDGMKTTELRGKKRRKRGKKMQRNMRRKIRKDMKEDKEEVKSKSGGSEKKICSP